ncbi:hypothetical protein NBRC116583_12760 [Arenicella sp. 4NH20-0111]
MSRNLGIFLRERRYVSGNVVTKGNQNRHSDNLLEHTLDSYGGNVKDRPALYEHRLHHLADRPEGIERLLGLLSVGATAAG